MSLQGTFDTLSVTELFGLLSTAGKTGALRLEAGEHDAGSLTGGFGVRRRRVVLRRRVRRRARSAGSEPELATRLVDVGFSLARCQSGSFRFNDAESPPFDVVATTRLEPAVAEIAALLEQWREIEARIPSLDARVRLAPVLRADEIVVTAREWSLLVALEGTPSVRELVSPRGRPMIEVCRTREGSGRPGRDRGRRRGCGAERRPRPACGAGRCRRRERRRRSRLGRRRPDRGAGAVCPVLAARPAAVDVADAAVEAADAIAAAEADAVAAGLVSRMTKNRRAVPDAFAGAGRPADGSGRDRRPNPDAAVASRPGRRSGLRRRERPRIPGPGRPAASLLGPEGELGAGQNPGRRAVQAS